MATSDIHAPWAEPVPEKGPMTVDELLALPDDGWQYELVEGRLVREPPEGFEASNIAARLLIRLGAYVEDHNLGDVTGEAGGYDLGPVGQKGTTLAPDVAFVRAERLPPHATFDTRKVVPFAPDLAVEVASPDQHRPEMGASRNGISRPVRALSGLCGRAGSRWTYGARRIHSHL